MEILEKGQYSGKVTGSCTDGGIMASITTYQQDNFNGTLHYHDNAHLSFVIRGACIEKKLNSYDRHPGRLTYYSAREPHQVMKVLQSSNHVNLEIEQVFFDEFNISDAAMDTAVNKNPDAKFLMIRIYKELMADDDFSAVSIQMLLLNLIHHTANLQKEQGIPSWVKRVYGYLQDRCDEKITLKDLSDVSGVHPVTISKYFPNYFSCTLGDYLRKLKVGKALNLIKTSPVSLTDVAYSCGFADQSHFIRTFKNYTGYLPAAYKKL